MRAPKPLGMRSPPCPKSRRGSVRYARVSRVTPDKLVARVARHKPTMDAVADNSAWAIKITHAKACSTALDNPERKKLLFFLEKSAERAEAAAAVGSKEMLMATPAACVPVARQETEVLEEPARLELGAEVSAWLDFSPCVPPCAI